MTGVQTCAFRSLDDAEYREILAGLNGLRRPEAFGIA